MLTRRTGVHAGGPIYVDRYPKVEAGSRGMDGEEKLKSRERIGEGLEMAPDAF